MLFFPFLFGVNFLVTAVTANVTCYTCSYQYPTNRDSVCVSDPDRVTTAKSVLCPVGRVCVTREVYTPALKTITSFNRDCQFAPVTTECVTAGGTNVCTYVCLTEYCNNQLGGAVESAVSEQLSGNARGEEGGPGNAADKPSSILSTSSLKLTSLLIALWFL